MAITISGGMVLAGGMSVTNIATGSVSLNGTNQYLSVPTDAAFDFGTGDFTVETWINLSNATQPAYAGIYVYRGGGSQASGLLIDFGSAGTSIRVTVSGTAVDFGAHGMSANTWWHLAVSRASGSVKVFVGGTQLGTTQSLPGNITNQAAYSVYLGASRAAGSAAYFMGGNLTNIRAVKGVAVYTSNFTPPTTNLAATQSANQNGNPSAAITGTQTSLLLDMTTSGTLLTDSSTYAFTVTNNGSATWSSSAPF
jgi:Concanavalin A-like lectin/glucanases superfamily